MKDEYAGFEKITNVRLPYDRRHPDPKQNYGIHGLDVWFILKGPKGATQFAVTFPVYLPHVERESASWKYKPEIMGTDVGYHAKEPQFEGHAAMPCNLFGGECYYDGSSLRADDWAKEIFAIRGEGPENEIWRRLKVEYVERFGDLA
jgi:hypothetical protein